MTKDGNSMSDVITMLRPVWRAKNISLSLKMCIFKSNVLRGGWRYVRNTSATAWVGSARDMDLTLHPWVKMKTTDWAVALLPNGGWVEVCGLHYLASAWGGYQQPDTKILGHQGWEILKILISPSKPGGVLETVVVSWRLFRPQP